MSDERRGRLLAELNDLHEMLQEPSGSEHLPNAFADLDPQRIPLLQDIVEDEAQSPPPRLPAPPASEAPIDDVAATLRAQALQAQLRDAAPGILAELLAEFAPRIEAELRQRLAAEMERQLRASEDRTPR